MPRFCRGSDSQSQVLFARSGLLRHLVEGVLNSQCSGNLQTNFDLLGELVKWNPEVFALFNDVLDDKVRDSAAGWCRHASQKNKKTTPGCVCHHVHGGKQLICGCWMVISEFLASRPSELLFGRLA